MTDEKNRIQASIDRINEKMKDVSQEEQDKLQKTMKTSFADLCDYQKLQSSAFACGKLNLEEAQMLYQMYGGEVPSEAKWDKLTLAEKVIGTQIAEELIKVKICDIL